jgi:hypothetical protein
MEAEIKSIIVREVAPRRLSYEAEMKEKWKRLFGQVAIRSIGAPPAFMVVAQVLGSSLAATLIQLAAALPLPELVAFLERRREVRRKNSLAYLVGARDAVSSSPLKLSTGAP